MGGEEACSRAMSGWRGLCIRNFLLETSSLKQEGVLARLHRGTSASVSPRMHNSSCGSSRGGRPAQVLGSGLRFPATHLLSLSLSDCHVLPPALAWGLSPQARRTVIRRPRKRMSSGPKNTPSGMLLCLLEEGLRSVIRLAARPAEMTTSSSVASRQPSRTSPSGCLAVKATPVLCARARVKVGRDSSLGLNRCWILTTSCAGF